MRKVKRPFGTTVYIEFPFRVLETPQEVSNALAGASETDVFVLQRMVDPESFQPIVVFAVRFPKTEFIRYEQMYFVARLEHVVDSKASFPEVA